MAGHSVENGLNGTSGGVGKNKNVVHIAEPEKGKEFQEVGKDGGFKVLHDHFSQRAGKGDPMGALIDWQ